MRYIRANILLKEVMNPIMENHDEKMYTNKIKK